MANRVAIQASADRTVRALSLSRFRPENRVCVCLMSGFCPVSVCPDSVRNFRKNAVRFLSVWPEKDETELSGLSVSLFADVCYRICLIVVIGLKIFKTIFS